MKGKAFWFLMLCIVSLLGCSSNNPTDLLVIGNSITLHGPAPSLGWYGNWGMAAPSALADFSHLTAFTLSVPLTVGGLGIERDPENALPEIPAMANKVGPGTAVVLEFGDNVPSDGLEAFGEGYDQLTAAVAKGNSLICVSTWWENPNVDNVIRAACAAHSGRYAYIGDLRTAPANTDLLTIQYSNWQVNDHPRQWGHRHIAERVLLQIRGQ